MTDAAMPVTGRAIKQFTESYLTSLGAEISKDGHRWTVTLPEEVSTDLELDGKILEFTDDPNDVGDEVHAISPESPFVERMLDESADRTPVGSLALTTDQVDIDLPTWLTDSSVDIVDKTFTPYYDRQAVCALFHVGIETVSEYQREELHAVAIDLNDHDERPRLADTYLELTNNERPELDEGQPIDEQKLMDALDVAYTSLETSFRQLCMTLVSGRRGLPRSSLMSTVSMLANDVTKWPTKLIV